MTSGLHIDFGGPFNHLCIHFKLNCNEVTWGLQVSLKCLTTEVVPFRIKLSIYLALIEIWLYSRETLEGFGGFSWSLVGSSFLIKVTCQNIFRKMELQTSFCHEIILAFPAIAIESLISHTWKFVQSVSSWVESFKFKTMTCWFSIVVCRPRVKLNNFEMRVMIFFIFYSNNWPRYNQLALLILLN